jgi:hypothetical protein
MCYTKQQSRNQNGAPSDEKPVAKTTGATSNQNGARLDEKPVAKTTGATSPAAFASLILFLLSPVVALFAQTTADTGSIVGIREP